MPAGFRFSCLISNLVGCDPVFDYLFFDERLWFAGVGCNTLVLT